MEKLQKRVAEEGSEPDTFDEYLDIIQERVSLLELILGRWSPNVMPAFTLPDPDVDAAATAQTACTQCVPKLSCIPFSGVQDICRKISSARSGP
jgi:hypothetical protein